MSFSVEKREEKYKGVIFDLIVDHIRYDSGTSSVREIARHPGGAVAVPVFDDCDVLLIRQYRHPIETTIYELPAGKLDPGEDPALCVKRELEEETGFRAEKWRKLTSMYTAPGFCTEVLHIYLATGLQKLDRGQRLEEGEESISIERIQLSRALDMTLTGAIVDGKTIAGLYLAERILSSSSEDRVPPL